MTKKEQEWKEEQQHFEKCRSLIRENLMQYKGNLKKLQQEVKELYQMIRKGDLELYDQLMTASSMEENAHNQVRKHKAALARPYFGRIDYTDETAGTQERIYIGKNGIRKDKTDVLIADWRAPISSVYYENELGSGYYWLPDGEKMPVDLHLKRTFDTEDGKLKGFYDSDVASNDEILAQYLSKNKDAELGEIIATIQSEQNEIIRESPFANVIVQGVAGSGKTTVAMHRISYILYNYEQWFTSNEFCIVGSNDLLLNYITSGLPELDVPNIRHMRMDQMFVHILGKEWKKKHQMVPADDTAKERCTLSFIMELEQYLRLLRCEIVDGKELRDEELGVILTQESCMSLRDDNPRFSVMQLLKLLEERMRKRIAFLMDEEDRERMKEKQAQYRGTFQKKKPSGSIFTIYTSFLTAYGQEHKVEMNGHIQAVSKGKCDVYDTAALALIWYRIMRKKDDEEFGQLFFDEAQDFGISVYYVLRQILPKCYFTIMGDVSQNINYETGMNDWEELKGVFLTDQKDQFRLLSKSYRNTIEISQFAGKILEKASAGQYKIDPVIRHGIPVEKKILKNEEEAARYTADLIQKIKEQGYETVAIVCRNEEESREVKERLKDRITLTDGEENGFSKGVMVLPVRYTKGLEFDTVILWNPKLDQAIKKPETAKLMYVAVTRALHELHILEIQKELFE